MKRGSSLVGSLVSLYRNKLFVCLALDAQVSPIQNIFSSMHKFHFICPHRPASWAGSRSASPVSLILSEQNRSALGKLYDVKWGIFTLKSEMA
jgi:hypothetical protein